MTHPLGFVGGQLGPDEVISLRPAFTARKSALATPLHLSRQFDQPALRYSALNPPMHAGRLDAQLTRHRGGAAEQLDDFRVFHDREISSN